MAAGRLEVALRSLLKIVAAAFAVFMVLAMSQEWRLFYASWLGGNPPPPRVEAAAREEALAALRLALELTGHLYRSGGDPRFAERMPAGETVVGEVLADVEYLARNHRIQDQRLERLEVLSAEALSGGRLEVLTREAWSVRILWAAGGEAEPRRREVVRGRYLLAPGRSGWRVERWAFHEAAAGGLEATR